MAIQQNNLPALIEALTKGATALNGSKTTETTSSNISKEGVSALLSQILSGTQGLASVAGGQRSAGLYNSTVNQQLINDLLTRTSAATASQQSGTTRTVQQAPAISVGKATSLAAQLQALSTAKNVLGPLTSKAGQKLGIGSTEDMSQKLADFIFGTTPLPDVSPSMGFLGADAPAASFSEAVSGQVGGNLDLSSALDSFASLFASPSSVDVASLDLSSSAPDVGTNADGSMKFDFSNFSSDANSAGASSTSGGTDINYLKIAQYADNPESFKNIYDFSDGDWKDDVSDITDAASVFFPPAGAVRPGLNQLDGNFKSQRSFFDNPGQWFENLMSGDDPFVNANIDLVKGVGKSIESTADMIGRAGETIGNATNDVIDQVFSWF
jgi:hypothetical protein